VNMRRFAIVASAVLLSACGVVVQQTQPTPQQVVDTASQKMGQLRSAKFDLTATILEQFPAAFAQSLGPQGAALQNLSIDLSGKGQISFPDKAAMAVQVKTGSVSVSTDLVIAAGRIYVKDPQSGSYVQAQGTGNVSQFTNQTDPLSAAALLKAAQSVKDLGGTSVGGTAVHHYQIVLDKNKVADQASTQAARDLMRQVLQNGTDPARSLDRKGRPAAAAGQRGHRRPHQPGAAFANTWLEPAAFRVTHPIRRHRPYRGARDDRLSRLQHSGHGVRPIGVALVTALLDEAQGKPKGRLYTRKNR